MAESFLTSTLKWSPMGNDFTIGVFFSVSPPPAIGCFPAGHEAWAPLMAPGAIKGDAF